MTYYSTIHPQETTRKLGFAIQYDEEKIGARLEQLQSQLSIPTQYKGRISELLSQLRFMHNSLAAAAGGGGDKYNVETFVQCDIHNLLQQQQEGIAALVEMTKQDMSDLQLISEWSRPTTGIQLSCTSPLLCHPFKSKKK